MPGWQHHAAHAFVGALRIKNSVPGKYGGPWWPQCCCSSPPAFPSPKVHPGMETTSQDVTNHLCFVFTRWAFLWVNPPSRQLLYQRTAAEASGATQAERKNSTERQWRWTNWANADDMFHILQWALWKKMTNNEGHTSQVKQFWKCVFLLIFQCFLMIINHLLCDNSKIYIYFFK